MARARSITTPVAKLGFGMPPFRDILDVLGEGPLRSWRFDELIGRVSAGGIGEKELLRALMILIDADIVAPAQPAARVVEAAAACSRLNADILRRSLTDGRIQALASPVTGGGVTVSRIQQLCLLALRQGAGSPQQLAEFAWKAIDASSDDRPEDRPTAAHVLREVLYFSQRLPHLTALKLADDV